MQKDFKAIYARDLQTYATSQLQPAERVLLEVLRNKWHQTRLLDLGVGAGRTTWFFAPLVDYYLGVDVVPEMIDYCRKTFESTSRQQFVVADAEDLSAYADSSFGAVHFSFNGIDHLSAQGREKALKEIQRVLQPGGVFFFSSHSLTVFPHHPQIALRGRNPLQWFTQARKRKALQRFYAKNNAVTSTDTVKQRGWAILPDFAHRGDMEVFCCHPKAQVKQLRSLGFTVDEVFTNLGAKVTDLENPEVSWWYHYLCKKN